MSGTVRGHLSVWGGHFHLGESPVLGLKFTFFLKFTRRFREFTRQKSGFTRRLLTFTRRIS